MKIIRNPEQTNTFSSVALDLDEVAVAHYALRNKVKEAEALSQATPFYKIAKKTNVGFFKFMHSRLLQSRLDGDATLSLASRLPFYAEHRRGATLHEPDASIVINALASMVTDVVANPDTAETNWMTDKAQAMMIEVHEEFYRQSSDTPPTQ